MTDTKNCAAVESTVIRTKAAKTAFLCLMIHDAILMIFHPLLSLSDLHYIIILNTVLGIQQTVVYKMYIPQHFLKLCWLTL
ncbi:hypothetical protein FZC78_10400 [Rossellomorea vietnamensis]|uniref:Uncharacterized protein n=1 Tax=Rossellomorea vietnamensis TaxID=218284 RepID=A0A5D4NSW5_9BACI|nr:hypothetical protein FZC78_10400 [Rossellomorea vietnamensis]